VSTKYVVSTLTELLGWSYRALYIHSVHSQYIPELFGSSHREVVPKVCTVNSKGTVTSSRGMHGYISVMASL